MQPQPEPPRGRPAENERPHWATKVFEDVPHSTTSLKHRRISKCFGPSMSEARQGIKPGSTVLFKLPFDKNYLSVTANLEPDVPGATRILCRWMDTYTNPLYSCYGVHELCISRTGSALQFRRYSVHRDRSTAWLALFFKTWEKMVLFHCAFVSLKARCPYTLRVNPSEYRLTGERVMFKGKIIDDKFCHSLTIFENEKNFAIRLQAAVGDGELKRCPVWTAFVTHQSTSPQWLYRRSKHRIWLMDIRLYVFCDNYRQSHQRQRHGEFEIYFVDAEAADHFEEFFLPPDEIIDVVDEGG
ncbi:hypothetical protein PVAG01_07235 [Phlyctema vagabunda]|uniref:Uncharacterized protein n=1 Tax=Phlyctema vagabunda TaxID=108571 RepID=A0ABR4PBV0_9HELO